MKRKLLLWLDDYRNPHENDWLIFSPIGLDVDVKWVKNYTEFVEFISSQGLPDGICFDHDLSDIQAFKSGYPDMMEDIEVNEKTGFDCAKWLVEYCMDSNLQLPLYSSQSANPVGRENVLKLLDNYSKNEK